MEAKKEMISIFKTLSLDRGVLAITGIIGYFSLSIENINLILAIVLKAFTILNIVVYLLLNYERIISAIKNFFRWKKPK